MRFRVLPWPICLAHTFGIKLGYDADATADARRQVIDFLALHGLTSTGPKR